MAGGSGSQGHGKAPRCLPRTPASGTALTHDVRVTRAGPGRLPGALGEPTAGSPPREPDMGI